MEKPEAFPYNVSPVYCFPNSVLEPPAADVLILEHNKEWLDANPSDHEERAEHNEGKDKKDGFQICV